VAVENCATYTVTRYHVMPYHTVNVRLNGVLVATKTAPALHLAMRATGPLGFDERRIRDESPVRLCEPCMPVEWGARHSPDERTEWDSEQGPGRLA
jgi:hypothetical protein